MDRLPPARGRDGGDQGAPFWSLRGWPIDWIQQDQTQERLDPLLTFGQASRSWFAEVNSSTFPQIFYKNQAPALSQSSETDRHTEIDLALQNPTEHQNGGVKISVSLVIDHPPPAAVYHDIRNNRAENAVQNRSSLEFSESSSHGDVPV